MAWNPAGAQTNGFAFAPGNGFTGISNDVFSQPIASFGLPANNAAGSAFGFDPSTMSAFSFNFGDSTPQPAPTATSFTQTGSAFDFSSPTFGNPSLGAPPMAFSVAPNSTPSSLYDLVSHPAIPSQAQQPATIPNHDLFSNLSIEDIKRGLSAPPPAHTPITNASPSPVPSLTSHIPSTSTHDTPSRTSTSEEMSGFSNGGFASEEASLFPLASETTTQKKPAVSHSLNPQTPAKTPERAPKSATEMLATIDLSAPSTPASVNSSETGSSTPYSNAGMVKSTIDWAKQRDLMASFLMPADAPKKAETSPTKEPKTNGVDDWSSYDEQTTGGDDWSSFDGSGAPHPQVATTAHENHSKIEHLPMKEVIVPNGTQGTGKTEEQVSQQNSSSAAPVSLDLSSISEEASKWNAGDVSGNSLGFDASAFDTSAFNFSGAPGDSAFHFPLETTSTTIELPIQEKIASTKEIAPTSSLFDPPVLQTPQLADFSSENASIGMNIEMTSSVPSHATGKKAETDLFASSNFPSSNLSSDVEFGGFTSNSSATENWGAFEGETATANKSNAGDSHTSLPVPTTSATPSRPPPSLSTTSFAQDVAPSPGRKKPETVVLDLSHFQLPSMPSTPSKPPQESVVTQRSSQEFNSEAAGFSGSSAPSLIDDVAPSKGVISTPAFSSIDFGSFSGASAPTVDLFASTNSTPEVPVWMQSNRSNDSATSQETSTTTVSQTTNWKDQPTMDELKRRLLEVLGTDKSAPYMWIFDNLGKHIAISFEERHSLAVGLIEDVKSGKVIWLSSSRVNQWHSVLTHCSEDLQRALSYLSNVSVQADLHSEEILISYLAHPQTVSYLSSLAKIKKVSSRILSAALHSNTNTLGGAATGAKFHTPKTTCCYLKPSVLKAIRALENSIEQSWNAIFTQVQEMIQSAGQSESPSLAALVAESEPVPHAPVSYNCFLCYRGFDEHEGPTQWQEKTYHASCANYWTNCISSKPPSL